MPGSHGGGHVHWVGAQFVKVESRFMCAISGMGVECGT
jgi:hypothetical protein